MDQELKSNSILHDLFKKKNEHIQKKKKFPGKPFLAGLLYIEGFFFLFFL